jgi:membrane-bound metal-dependent hydrolase YbcI (DUF457 family)
MIIIVGLVLVYFMVSFYMLFRNEWVYRNRIKQIEEDIDVYTQMPTYNQMMYKYFWVWKFENFKHKKR